MQFDLQRRRKLVARFRERRRTPVGDRCPDFDDLSNQVDRILKRVLGALSDASRSGHSPESLVEAFALLDQMVFDWQHPVRRPHRNRGRVVGESLELLSAGISKFVDALEASDMIAAKELERLGNQTIQEAEDVLSELTAINETESLLAEASPGEALNAVVQKARHLTRHQDSLREFDQILRSGTGWNSAAEGLGITLHAVHTVALTSFDLKNFTSVLQSTVQALETNPATTELFDSDEWTRLHARAAAFLGSSVAAIQQEASLDSDNDFVIAHRAVGAIATFRDGVLKHSLASLLGNHESDYFKLIKRKTGKLLQMAAAKHPDLMLNENLIPELRNAGAHADIDIVDNSVKIDESLLSAEEFLDKFLAYLEVTMATFIGVLLASGARSDTAHLERYLSPRDREIAISMFLGVFHIKLDEVQFSQSTMSVRASGPQPDWITLAGALSSIPSGNASELSICVSSDDQEHMFVANLDRFRDYADNLGALALKPTILRMAEIVAGCRLDGRSLWNVDEWERFSQEIIKRDRDEDLMTWIRNLRQMRKAAREAGIATVADRCERVIASVRSTERRQDTGPASTPLWLQQTLNRK